MYLIGKKNRLLLELEEDLREGIKFEDLGGRYNKNDVLKLYYARYANLDGKCFYLSELGEARAERLKGMPRYKTQASQSI